MDQSQDLPKIEQLKLFEDHLNTLPEAHKINMKRLYQDAVKDALKTCQNPTEEMMIHMGYQIATAMLENKMTTSKYHIEDVNGKIVLMPGKNHFK